MPSQVDPSTGMLSSEAIRPTIVCLIGSRRFRTTMNEIISRETLNGKIVLGIGVFDNVGDDTKSRLDELHLRKIDLADEVLVVNQGGYTGESTKAELKYALDNNKRVRWLVQPQPPGSSDLPRSSDVRDRDDATRRIGQLRIQLAQLTRERDHYQREMERLSRTIVDDNDTIKRLNNERNQFAEDAQMIRADAAQQYDNTRHELNAAREEIERLTEERHLLNKIIREQNAERERIIAESLSNATRLIEERDDARGEIERLGTEMTALRESLEIQRQMIAEGRLAITDANQRVVEETRDLRNTLRSLAFNVEWNGPGEHCPWCNRHRSNGHIEACQVGRLTASLE